MAKVRYGSTVVEARGSISGTVFSRNAGGAYIRARIVPTDRNTELQAAAKSLFSAAVNVWTNTLTALERSAWNTYAASVPYTDVFGESRYYSGQQRYVQCYITAVNAGLATSRVSAAPTTYTEAEGIDISEMAVNEGAATPDVTASFVNTVAPLAADAGDLLLCYIGQPVTQATNYFKGPYRFAGSVAFVSGTAYPDLVVDDPYGITVTEGLLLPVKFRILGADNRISPISMTVKTVGAYVTP